MGLAKRVRQLRADLARQIAPRPRPQKAFDGTLEGGAAVSRFIEEMRRIPAPDVLEMGAHRSVPERSTVHPGWVPHARTFCGTDLEPGLDVDVVADVHRLSEVFGEERFDGVISAAVFEHVQYPWIAAAEIAKVLRPGGVACVITVQSFVLHAYPHDYFRFSASALRSLFPESMNLETLVCHYEHPCLILADGDPHQHRRASFLYVSIAVRKTGPTPSSFVADLGPLHPPKAAREAPGSAPRALPR